ncbi:hypothetical protein EPN52_14260 [bacterium]|nr:MAG: hypothetical protein EPN52_14260 [bacterium]
MSRRRGLVRVVFALVFLAGVLYVIPPDGDLPWQRWLGQTILMTHHLPRALGSETFTAVGAPWLPQEWLFGVAAAFLTARLGYAWFAVLVAACAFTALLLVELRCARRGAAGMALMLCGGLAAISLLESFGVRAQVVAWPLFAALLVLLDEEGWRLWLVLPLTILWSNVHASVVIVPCLVLLDAAGRWLETRAFSPALVRRIWLAAAAAAATLVNPFGWRLDAYAIALFHSPVIWTIREWRPATLDDLAFVGGAIPLALLTFLGLRARLLTLRELPPALVFAMLAFAHVRNVPLAGMLLAAPATAWLMQRWPAGPQARALESRGAIFSRIAAAAGALVVAAVLLHARHVTPERIAPRTMLAYLERQRTPAPQRVFCEDFSWCSAAIGWPNLRVFVDSRCDPYPVPVWNDYRAIAGVRPRWHALLETWRVDAVIARRDGRLARALSRKRDWRLVRRDERYALYESRALRRAVAAAGA